MAEQEKDPTPVAQMVVGETWKVPGGDEYLVTKVDPASRACRLKPTSLKSTMDYQYDFDACTRAGLYRIAKVPNPHYFGDRYASAKHADGSIVKLCFNCGLDGSEPGPCVPRNWRPEFEKCVAELTDRRTAAVASPRPRFTFRQSNPIVAGGIFSLRDENARRR